MAINPCQEKAPRVECLTRSYLERDMDSESCRPRGALFVPKELRKLLLAMLFFNRKKEVSLENFCRDFYENLTLNPVIGGIDVSTAFSDAVYEQVSKADPAFTNVGKQKLADELMILRFELFALAWTHKFVSGKIVITQSVFTRQYLHEKEREDIWDGMENYSQAIDGATLHWLSNLGKRNLIFNYHTREDLTDQNIEDAKEMGVELDGRVGCRLWSENAWRQKFVLTAIQLVFYENLRLNPDELNDDALARMASAIKGLYDGALQSISKVKIKS